MELEAMNICSKGQVVCYDGPGFKSPRLQFTYNQSVWECLSSTFQMMCKFSRVDDVCTNGLRLYYRAIHGRDHKVKNLPLIQTHLGFYDLKIDEAHSNGTSKYMHHPNTASSRGRYLYIVKVPISFRYMLNEGNSCMYGGIYIVRTIETKDSEVMSFCSPAESPVKYTIDIYNISVVIIHYSEYSREEIKFQARYVIHQYSTRVSPHLDLNQKYMENTLSITVPKVTVAAKGYIHPLQLKLRQIQYINISCDAVLDIYFASFLRTSCMNITIFYHPHVSNIRGRQYDHKAMGYRSFYHWGDFVQSIFINMCSCTLVEFPLWAMAIETPDKSVVFNIRLPNTIKIAYLPADILLVRSTFFGFYDLPQEASAWVLVHMLQPEDVPAYAIWRVFTILDDIVSHVSIEVLIDNHYSSSVYEWNDFKSLDGVYITVDKAVNVLFEPDNTNMLQPKCKIKICFMRHFIHDDETNNYVTGQAPRQTHFSFHNQR